MVGCLPPKVGPWVVGSLVEGYTGAVFAWGVLVNNQLVEAQVPFAFYFLHCAVVHPVMVVGIGQILDHRNGVKACRGLLLTSSLLLLLVLVTAFSLFSTECWPSSWAPSTPGPSPSTLSSPSWPGGRGTNTWSWDTGGLSTKGKDE